MVVVPTLSKRDGRFIELLGYYDPTKDPAKIEIKKDRLDHWIKNGAIVSQGVTNLMKKSGIKSPKRA